MAQHKKPSQEPAPQAPSSQEPEVNPDDAWISVIQKMDEAYADLVRYQVQVEEQNAALEEAQSFFDSVQSAMSDVLIVCDHRGRIQQVNRALEQLAGVTQDELVERDLDTLFVTASHPQLKAMLAQVGRLPVRDCELELQGAEEAVPLAVNCSPRKNHRGRLVGMVMVGRPLGELQRAYKELHQAHAELKLAQERLIQAEKMASLGRLVAGVAHELNNPISFVYGNMHALKRYTERIRSYFDAIHSGASHEELKELRAQLRLDKAIRDLDSLVQGTMEGADRVKEIVHDLRQFSSTQRTAKKPFDLAHVTRSALHWITKESKHDIAVDDRMPAELPVLGHSGQIHQVVVNLIQNAADAMTGVTAPQLILNAGQDEGKVWLEVHDNGPGVPEEHLSSLFDPFFTTKSVGEGTGLGLSISYGIVSEHGGELSIRNHLEGGAVARLELPQGQGEEHV